MALINLAAGEINYKIVYYGCALGGKTSSIQYVYRKVNPEVKGKLVSIATEEERTLYFDFLPLELGKVRGLNTRFHLYTVPGQRQYNASRKLVIQGVDGIVFVADSQLDRLDDNVDAYLNMWDNLEEQDDSPLDLGLAMQYNKRDLMEIFPARDLDELFNQTGSPSFESCALSGEGIFDTLRNVCKQVIARTEAG
ncbi:MAG: gliding-motility protein MglA [Thermoleophilia bacterium]|nr:gliding-motility protein MglA [Thermoleophilia bacterium]